MGGLLGDDRWHDTKVRNEDDDKDSSSNAGMAGTAGMQSPPGLPRRGSGQGVSQSGQGGSQGGITEIHHHYHYGNEGEGGNGGRAGGIFRRLVLVSVLAPIVFVLFMALAWFAGGEPVQTIMLGWLHQIIGYVSSIYSEIVGSLAKEMLSSMMANSGIDAPGLGAATSTGAATDPQSGFDLSALLNQAMQPQAQPQAQPQSMQAHTALEPPAELPLNNTSAVAHAEPLDDEGVTHMAVPADSGAIRPGK